MMIPCPSRIEGLRHCGGLPLAARELQTRLTKKPLYSSGSLPSLGSRAVIPYQYSLFNTVPNIQYSTGTATSFHQLSQNTLTY